MEEKKSFAMFRDYLEYMEGMTDQDIGAAMRAVWMVANGQEPPELSGVAWMFFTIVKRDMERASVRAQASRENGAKGGRPKKEEPLSGQQQETPGETDEKPVEETQEKPRDNPKKPNQNQKKPEKSLHKTVDIDSNKDSKEALSARACVGFAEFWEKYPKKADHQDAMNAWKELSPTEETQRQIFDALDRAKSSAQWLEENGRYIPRAAKWLREHQWANVVPLHFSTRSYDTEELEEMATFDLLEAVRV